MYLITDHRIDSFLLSNNSKNTLARPAEALLKEEVSVPQALLQPRIGLIVVSRHIDLCLFH